MVMRHSCKVDMGVRFSQRALMKIVSFEAVEDLGIGIPNPRTVRKFTGPPEMLERLIAFWVQNGYSDGLTEEEKAKYLKIEVDI